MINHRFGDWFAIASCLAAVTFIPHLASGEDEILRIHYASSLPETKVAWIHEFANGIESATGKAVRAEPGSVSPATNKVWLNLEEEDFEQRYSEGYATVSLENLLGAWVKDSLGVHWLAPGEVVWDGREFEWIGFDEWIESGRSKGIKRFDRRDLFPICFTFERHWATVNGLYPTQRVGFRHSHFRIINQEYYTQHPEAVAKGPLGAPIKSSFLDSGQYSNHPDLLDESVIDAISRAALESEESTSEAGFSIFPNDSYVFGSIPEEKSELQPTGYYNGLKDYSKYVYHFANEVAGRVFEERPDSLLWMDAYMNWLNVPDFDIHPGIAIGIADDRSQWYDLEYKKRDLNLIKNWVDRGGEHLGATDYIFGKDFLIPRSLVGVVSESIPLYYNEGLKSIYQSYVAPLWGYDAHTTWLAAQLVWDAEADPKELLHKFFLLYYGPAAESMRRFFDTAERLWMEQPGDGQWLKYWKDPHQVSLYGDEELNELERWLTVAEASIAGDEAYARRVGYTRDLFNLTKRFVEMVHLRWRISIGTYAGFSPAYKPYTLNDIDMATEEGTLNAIARLANTENELAKEMERLAKETPLHSRLKQWQWLFDDSPASRAIRSFEGYRPKRVLINGWGKFDGVWNTEMIDTEEASIRFDGEMVRAENVFRGHVSKVAYAKEGNVYRAVVPISGKVGPSSFIYVRLDFYSKDWRKLISSRWDRLAPGTYGTPFVIGPQLEAPANSMFVRLYIRLFHQERGDWVEIGDPRLMELN